jgi:hypothetical protein
VGNARSSGAFDEDTLLSLFDDLREDDFPTAEMDVSELAREAEAKDPVSGIRRSFPTLTNEVGVLPDEPEEDVVFRCFGCAARVLRVSLSPAAVEALHLEPRHRYVLGLLDGETAICDVLDRSTLARRDTLYVLEELVILDVVG